MLSRDTVFGIVFLYQSIFGFLGNATVFLVYMNSFITQPQQKKPTDLILTHLTVANTVTLLTRGVPEIMVAFGMRNIFNDVGCQSVMYINRVSRGLSICTTCLLSVFQAVTISPSTSQLARFKPRASKYILPSFFFFWILNMLIYIRVITSIQAIRNVTIVGWGYALKYCSTLPDGDFITSITFLSAMTIRDLFFVFLMSWSSGYMVNVLYQHRKQVQHIHSTCLTPRSSVETRATQTILVLVSCFACFYWINSIITVYLTNVVDKDLQLESTTAFLSACYPTLCPLVLVSSDPRVRRNCCALGKGRHPSHTIRALTNQVIPKH
ncbi:vomeronasal 1 receptor ornAnaV1R3250 [Ornithorhynchus anatinus]|uniref:Vomeronasal type-1 receptor n=1 Tax=Ornithorhynchus anatinus TaxID=9258 RepID=A0A6I8PAI3_ORNAN|nr:vomeronasal 1 receptor ornAnaV1R3250 [Ornithorhynchus anatinus]